MATLTKELILPCSPARFWSAARDLGALHTRLVPGFVTQTELNDTASCRRVTFANGMVVNEEILSCDDQRRRLAWNAHLEGTTHYNAVLEAFEHPDGTRVVWTTDLLPNQMAQPISDVQEQALAAMKLAFPASSP
jgi:hypothetical protein